MIPSPMENDYWRTRTVAEAMKDYAFLRLTCACGRITDYPFPLLLQRPGVSRDSFIGNIRFRCKKWSKQIKIGVHSQVPSLTR
jgi:hypothetical protein